MGSVHIDGSDAWKIKPYRMLKESDLKHKSKKTDLKAWRGIFKLMEKAVTVPESMISIDNEFVSKSYQDATDYLKANYSFLYIQNSEEHMATWKVSTWFRKTRPSEVRKNGTEEDKAKLPPAGKLNNPHSRKRSFEVPSRRKANKVAKRGTKKYDEATGEEDV